MIQCFLIKLHQLENTVVATDFNILVFVMNGSIGNIGFTRYNRRSVHFGDTEQFLMNDVRGVRFKFFVVFGQNF